MNFIDNTGHIFNLPSFNYNPIGYEYTENRYIFWIDNKDTAFLSINNYYIRPIYFISNYQLNDVDITINSNVFKLIGASYVQESLSKYGYVRLGSNKIYNYDTAKSYVKDQIDKYGYIEFNENTIFSIYEQAIDYINKEFEKHNYLSINNNDITDYPSKLKYSVDKNNYEHNDILEIPLKVNINEEDLSQYESDTVYMYPFYVIGRSFEEGTITSNILIHTRKKDYYYVDYENDPEKIDFEFSEEWCPITVGGEFGEENEILIINGQNMGVVLPNEILRAVYNGSYENRSFDETLFNEKLKEYLINYMCIKGETGNYNSAINSLKWFGWGKHLDMVSLLKTDNEYTVQFIRDYFNVNTDILESFEHFRHSTLLSLIVKDNRELTDEDGNIIYDTYDLDELDDKFMGENQPIMEDLFKRFEKRKFGGRGEETYYWRPYYDFIFNELAFKLSALKYYFEEYFLPVHLSIHNASIEHKVYANDNKQLTRSTSSYTEKIIELGMNIDDLVEFPKTNLLWLNEQTHIIDDNYNEWVNPNYENGDFYYIHDTCMNIPIKFNVKELYPDKICDVVMILEKKTLTRYAFSMYINYPINILNDKFYAIEYYSNYNVTDNLYNYECAYSEDNNKYGIWFNNYETLCEHYKASHFIMHDLTNVKDDIFIVDIQDVLNTYFNTDFNLDDYVIYNKLNNTGLSLNYNQNIIKDGSTAQITSEYNSLYLYKKINGSNLNIEKRPEIIINIPNKDDIFVNPLSNPDNTNNAHTKIYIYKDIYLKFKYPANYIDEFYINNVKHSDDVFINYFPTTTVVFEKHFRYDPNIDEYANLVIYPKLFTNVKTDVMTNEHNTDDATLISYWIGSQFTLRVLVNNKWHRYDFTVKIPDIQFDMGRLTYKYWYNDLKLQSRFNQLSELSYNEETGKTDIEFNSFMHEPELTTVNHINFFEDFVQYLKSTNARFINKENIESNIIYYFIDVDYEDENGDIHNQRIYIPVENIGSDIVVPKKYLNDDMIYFLYYRNTTFILSDFDSLKEVYKVEEITNLNIIGGNDHVLIFDDNIADENNYDTQYVDIENYKLFKYDSEKNVYYLDILSEHYEYHIKSSMKTGMTNLISQYIEQHFITNSDAYKNQIHIFDLFRLNHHTDYNRLLIHNNIDLRYHGVRFKHNDYINGSMLEVSGNINDLIDDVSYRNSYNNLFKTEIGDSAYSYMINTYDDLTIYSAYEGDLITKTNTPDPIGYLYYEGVNEDGTFTGELYESDKRLNIVNTLLSYSYIYADDLINNTSILYKLAHLDSQPITILFGDDEYELKYDNHKFIYDDVEEWANTLNENYLNLYIERNNITTDVTPIFFKLELYRIDYYDENNNPAGFIKENPTCYKFKEHIFDIDSFTFKDKNYLFKFYLYAKENKIYNNIEHIYNKDIEFINDEAYGIINNKYVKLHPYYGDEEDNLDDTLFVKEILKQQPGYYWFDITNDEIFYIDEYMEVLEIDELDENTEKSNPNSPDTDISTLTKWRKYLKIDITNKILKDIDYLRETANDGIFDYDIINDKFDDGFITIVRIENARGEVTYETKKFTVKFIDKPVNVTVFFAIDKNTIKCDDEGYFIINVCPEIRRSYDAYDILEYTPIDYIDEDSSVTIPVGDKMMTYGDINDSSIELYANMFTKRIDKLNDNVSISSIECIPELNIDNGNVEYDMYLMHDEKQWYIVYISKDTCNKIITLNNFNPSKTKMLFNINDKQYMISHVTSGRKFLLNRYKYISTNGKNTFDRRDIIAARVINNGRLPIDINTSKKWQIHPLSLGIPKNDINIESNAQMCIIDAPYINDEHYTGYYSLTYHYNIDRTATHQNKLYGKFRIV